MVHLQRYFGVDGLGQRRLAMILEAHPEVKVDDDRCVIHLKHALRDSLGASHSPTAGYGELDAMAWFNAVDPSCPEAF